MASPTAKRSSGWTCLASNNRSSGAVHEDLKPACEQEASLLRGWISFCGFQPPVEMTADPERIRIRHRIPAAPQCVVPEILYCLVGQKGV